MSEFCRKCANELGMQEHDEPCFCEHCKKYIQRKSIIDFILKKIREVIN